MTVHLPPYFGKTPMFRQVVFAVMCVGFTSVQAQVDPGVALRPELVQGGKLVDKDYGFSVKINPAFIWTAQQLDDRYVNIYKGTDSATGNQYFISVDLKRYPEMNKKHAEEYFGGKKTGVESAGWQVHQVTLSSSDLPLANSYRHTMRATHPNGKKSLFVSHVSTQGRLFTVTAILFDERGEIELQAMLRSFRALPAALINPH